MRKSLLLGASCAALLAACVDSPVGPVSTPQPELDVVALTGTRYYVNASTGRDNNDGLSPTKAWKTLGKVSRNWGLRRFAPGDSIFFTGTFAGPLTLGSGSSGTLAAPIALRGPATIVPATSSKGIEVINAAGIDISMIDVIAAGYKTHTNECVLFYYTGGTYQSVRLRNMRISGCGSHALWVGAYQGGNVVDVLVDGLDISGSVNGLAMQGDHRGALKRVTVRNTDSHDNPGRTNSTYGGGNGIQLGNVDDGVIERSRAWNNGAENNNTSGPVGIWTWESSRVVIRYNESYRNQTMLYDGGGFDLDGGCQSCVLEYNYAHDNEGAGLLGYQYVGASPWTNNVIRYNISERDGMGLDAGGSIRMGAAAGSTLTSAWVFGNTVFVDRSGAFRGSALHLDGAATSNVRIHNNIFVALNNSRLVRQLSGVQYDVRGNDYWTGGGPAVFRWNGVTYSGLAAFRASGKEAQAGTDVDPRLASPGGGGTLAGRFVGAQPLAYKLLTGSPMPTGGMDIRAAGAPLPAMDFYGAAIPATGLFRAIGAASK